MRKIIIAFIVFSCAINLIGCGVVREQQLMYNEKIYGYDEKEFSAALPEGYELVGVVMQTSDSKIPKENWHGCRVVVGQNVYASDESPNDIYLEFENGYARFYTR